MNDYKWTIKEYTQLKKPPYAKNCKQYMQIFVCTMSYAWLILGPLTPKATSSAGGGSSGCSEYIIRQPPAMRLGSSSNRDPPAFPGNLIQHMENRT